MKNDFHSNRKILTKMVFGIAVYVAIYFATTIILLIQKDNLSQNLQLYLPATFACIGAILTISQDLRSKLIYDKNAAFSKKPYFILFTIILSISLTIIFNFLFSLIPWEIFGDKNVVQDNDYFYSYPLLIRIIAFVILIPISEEILFRGVIFSHLRAMIPYWAAAILTGVVFGLYHGNLMQGLYAFFMGAIMCLVLEYGGSFFYAVAFHCTANLLSNLCSEYEYIYKVVYSPVGISLAFIYLVVAITISYVFKNRLTLKDKEC